MGFEDEMQDQESLDLLWAGLDYVTRLDAAASPLEAASPEPCVLDEVKARLEYQLRRADQHQLNGFQRVLTDLAVLGWNGICAVHPLTVSLGVRMGSKHDIDVLSDSSACQDQVLDERR